MPGRLVQPERRLIVTGATGKQGGALIQALLAAPAQPFEIYAVTRNKSSKGAQKLASQPNVHVIEGEFDNPKAIFAQVPKPWGLFSVTVPLKGADKEEAQGKAMNAAAFDAGIQHIVFTATDRGGPISSETDSTPIPHFQSKYNIEKDIISRCSATNGATTWTFLRPVAFMENLTNDFLGKGFISMWRLNGPDKKLQLISTKDIGRVAADAFLHADSEEYRNKAVSLAGDEISPKEAASIFKSTTGQEIPSTFGLVGHGLRWGLKEQLGLMFDWFRDTGYGAPLKENRQRYPFMQDFRTWVETESAWKKQ